MWCFAWPGRLDTHDPDGVLLLYAGFAHVDTETAGRIKVLLLTQLKRFPGGRCPEIPFIRLMVNTDKYCSEEMKNPRRSRLRLISVATHALALWK